MIFIKHLILKTCTTSIVSTLNSFGNQIIDFYQKGPQSLKKEKPFKIQGCELSREHEERKNDFLLLICLLWFGNVLANS